MLPVCSVNRPLLFQLQTVGRKDKMVHGVDGTLSQIQSRGMDGSAVGADAAAGDPLLLAAVEEVKTLGGCCKDSDRVLEKINSEHEKLSKQGLVQARACSTRARACLKRFACAYPGRLSPL